MHGLPATGRWKWDRPQESLKRLIYTMMVGVVHGTQELWLYRQQIGWWTISVLLQTFGRVVRFYLNASTMGGCLKLKILKNQRNPPQDMDWKCTPTKFRECLLGYFGVYCWWTKSCISWCACIEWYTYMHANLSSFQLILWMDKILHQLVTTHQVVA